QTARLRLARRLLRRIAPANAPSPTPGWRCPLPNEIGRLQRDFLSDHAADREAEHVRLVQTKCTGEGHCVGAQDAAQAWKDIAGNLSPSGPGAARRRSHGKIVLRVA